MVQGGLEAGELPPDVSATQPQTRRLLDPVKAVLDDQAEGVIPVEITMSHGHRDTRWGHEVSFGKREHLPLPVSS
jgi:hypothetical protein